MYVDNLDLESKGGWNFGNFRLKLLASCSACKQRYNVDEIFEVFMGSRDKKVIEGLIIKKIQKARSCPYCGILSVIPQNELSKFQELLPLKLESMQLPQYSGS